MAKKHDEDLTQAMRGSGLRQPVARRLNAKTGRHNSQSQQAVRIR